MGGDGSDCGYGIALDGSGNVYITGRTTSFGDLYNDVLLLKYGSDGTLLWNTTWGGSQLDWANGIALDGSGNVYITGITASCGDSCGDAFLLKCDSDGNLLWNTTWGGNDYDCGYGIALDNSGNIFITGMYTESGHDVFLLKYDSFGKLLWNTICKDSKFNIGFGIAVNVLGNVYITGQTNSIDGLFLLKYDSFGNLLGNKTWWRYGVVYGRGIVVDALGNVYITGRMSGYSHSWTSAFILKYRDEIRDEIDETIPNDADGDDQEISGYQLSLILPIVLVISLYISRKIRTTFRLSE